MSRRLEAMGVAKYSDGFRIRCHEDALAIPYRWKKPALVFVNSMSDLFHPEVSLEFIQRAFAVMADCPHLTFQILTKRSERLAKLSGELPWPSNIWMGVSVENRAVSHRIHDLCEVPAAVRFLSCEPLIGPLGNFRLKGIDWVIVGGESGVRARPMDTAWVLSIKRQCQRSSVPFFFKQWGGRNKKAAGRILEGTTFDELPSPTTSRYASV